MVERRLDEVAKALASKDAPAEDILCWMEEYRTQQSISRRAWRCAIWAWVLMTVAAVIGGLSSWHTGSQLAELVSSVDPDDRYGVVQVDTARIQMSQVMPGIMAFIAAVLMVGGLLALILRKFPFFSWVQSATDWSIAGGAMSRLLASGCTYVEAFEAARQVCSTADCRWWLKHQATRLSQGMEPKFQSKSTSDATTIELLIREGQVPAEQQWGIAGEYFNEMSKQRLSLVISAIPVLATLIAGLLIWLSVASTLGAMWGSLGTMIRGMSY